MCTNVALMLKKCHDNAAIHTSATPVQPVDHTLGEQVVGKKPGKHCVSAGNRMSVKNEKSSLVTQNLQSLKLILSFMF